MTWYLILALVFTLGFTTFAVQNSQLVTLQFLGWEMASFPLVMLLIFSAITGVLVTLLFSLPSQVKLSSKNRELNARIKQLEKELEKANKVEG